MQRSINLNPFCEIISITRRILRHNLIDEITLIVEISGDNYVIQDDVLKVEDVSQMPHYIIEDWINYNKKELTNQILDLHIKEYEDKVDSQWPTNERDKEVLSRLKSIKRNQIIKKIL